MQARNSLLVVEFKTQPLDVVAQGLNVCEFQIHKSLLATDEDFLAVFGRLCGSATRAVTVESNARAYEADGEVDRSQRVALRGLRRVLTEALCVVTVSSVPEVLVRKGLPGTRKKRQAS